MEFEFPNVKDSRPSCCRGAEEKPSSTLQSTPGGRLGRRSFRGWQVSSGAGSPRGTGNDFRVVSGFRGEGPDAPGELREEIGRFLSCPGTAGRKFIPEVEKVLTGRRRGGMTFGGGPSKVEFVPDRNEVAQRAELHPVAFLLGSHPGLRPRPRCRTRNLRWGFGLRRAKTHGG